MLVWDHITKCTVVKRITNVLTAQRPLHLPKVWRFTWESTLERNLINVTYVKKNSLPKGLWHHVKKHTGEKTIQVWRMWSIISGKATVRLSFHESAHWRKAFSMHLLWWSIHTQIQFELSHEKSAHWRETLQVHGMQQIIHCWMAAEISQLERGLSGVCECDAAFILQVELENHMNKMHQGDSRYYCDICDQLFILNIDLQFHMMTPHWGEA